jgi:hypothetical protein
LTALSRYVAQHPYHSTSPSPGTGQHDNAANAWLQVNVFLDDMAHFAEMNGVFEKYFAHKPARSCVAVKQLPKGVPVEIECIAYNGRAAKL